MASTKYPSTKKKQASLRCSVEGSKKNMSQRRQTPPINEAASCCRGIFLGKEGGTEMRIKALRMRSVVNAFFERKSTLACYSTGVWSTTLFFADDVSRGRGSARISWTYQKLSGY